MTSSSTSSAGSVEESESSRYLRGELIAEKYRLLEPLGKGGHGLLWVAHNEVLDIEVALKLILPDEKGRELRGDRLLEEARAAARLGHPAIVRVFDFGVTHLGDPFVVMELLRGESLADRIHETRMDPVEAVRILLPIVDALSAAHARGIVHRDVKPDNIFLVRDEIGRIQPKLLDFGIARRADVDRKLTARGSLIGTPDYMSPEQARGRTDVDERSDVWCTCVVLYEMITGKVPFDGENYNALLNAIIETTPTPTADLQAGDAELWRVIATGLQKKPEDRWESMRSLGEALALWLYEQGVREDICDTSVRGSWLESGHSGVKVAVGSIAPKAASESATLDVPGRRRWILPAVALIFVASVAVAFLMFRAKPREVVADASARPAPSSAPISETAEPPSSAAASAASEPARAPLPESSATAEPEKKPRAQKTAPRSESSSTAKKKHVDFGF